MSKVRKIQQKLMYTLVETTLSLIGDKWKVGQSASAKATLIPHKKSQ